MIMITTTTTIIIIMMGLQGAHTQRSDDLPPDSVLHALNVPGGPFLLPICTSISALECVWCSKGLEVLKTLYMAGITSKRIHSTQSITLCWPPSNTVLNYNRIIFNKKFKGWLLDFSIILSKKLRTLSWLTECLRHHQQQSFQGNYKKQGLRNPNFLCFCKKIETLTQKWNFLIDLWTVEATEVPPSDQI